MLTQAQIDFFNEHGFIRLEQVYSPAEIKQMSDELAFMMENFATWEGGWRGAWRKEYMEEAEDKQSVLVYLHELHHFSSAWMRAVVKPELAEAIGELLPSDSVEIHHSTLHAKAPGAGSPFPMHQDDPFYPHADGRYIDALVHVDDADEQSGCLKFLDGSHKLGKLQHITGSDHEPFLPTDQYRLEDAVSVPAKAGDVILFHLWTVHGSALNRAGRWRRLVRVGYRDPRNQQLGGQALGRPGLIVRGVRPKQEDVKVDVYGLWASKPA
jgi:phytanoyl-CoA hydroxylase